MNPTSPEVKTTGADELPQPTEERPVVFTDEAIARIKEFASRHEDAEGKHLRVSVQGGGCSGFEYGFSFDEPKENDELVPQGDIEILLDPFSRPYLEGCIIDYQESFAGSGFVVNNPNATGTCGCGQSFQA